MDNFNESNCMTPLLLQPSKETMERLAKIRTEPLPKKYEDHIKAVAEKFMREKGEMKVNEHIDFIVGGIMIIIIGIMMFAIVIFDSANDEKAWNNGYCSCGGKWEYQQAVGHRYDTDYIYKCDTCGKLKEFEYAR